MEIYSLIAVFSDGSELELDNETPNKSDIRRAKREAIKRGTTLAFFKQGSYNCLGIWCTRQVFDVDGQPSIGEAIPIMLAEAINRPYDPVGVAAAVLMAKYLIRAIKQ